MGCPHYEDYTRSCIQFFPHVLNYTSFDTCESDKYFNCLAYIALKSGFRCKHLNQCVEDLVEAIPPLVKYFIEDDKTVQIFKSMVEKYCSSKEKHDQCACYKLFEQGIHPPAELSPDGKTIRLRDLLFKKEIVIE
jgi:hypothetical protein